MQPSFARNRARSRKHPPILFTVVVSKREGDGQLLRRKRAPHTTEMIRHHSIPQISPPAGTAGVSCGGGGKVKLDRAPKDISYSYSTRLSTKKACSAGPKSGSAAPLSCNSSPSCRLRMNAIMTMRNWSRPLNATQPEIIGC